jgi:Tol biopolymer transport system component
MRYNKVVLSAGALFTLLSCEDPTSARDPVAILVSASAVSLLVGEERVLDAWLIDATGRWVSGSIEWSSSDPSIASIDRVRGVVSAITVGTATMKASSGVLSTTAIVTVRLPGPPVRITSSHTAASIVAGGSDSLAAQAYDSTGELAAAAVKWSSADVAVATVGEADGVLVGIAAGTTTVTATAGPVSATVMVSVIALASSLSFTRWTDDDHADVLSFSATSKLTRPVERAPQFTSIAGPAWSADGSSLAIEVIHEFTVDPVEHVSDYSSDLYIADSASPVTSTWRPLTTNGFSKSPSWSPDGGRIAYLQQPTLFSNNDIYVITVSDGARVRVTPTAGWFSTPRWSPDGTRLSFSAYDPVSGNDDVYIVNADGSGLTNVSRNAAFDFQPVWSPDGAQLVFVSSRDGARGDYGIYVMDVDGANVRRLTSGHGFIAGLAWSPDGRHIAFSARGSVFVMNADGSSPARLTRPPSSSWDASPTWRR